MQVNALPSQCSAYLTLFLPFKSRLINYYDARCFSLPHMLQNTILQNMHHHQGKTSWYFTPSDYFIKTF